MDVLEDAATDFVEVRVPAECHGGEVLAAVAVLAEHEFASGDDLCTYHGRAADHVDKIDGAPGQGGQFASQSSGWR